MIWWWSKRDLVVILGGSGVDLGVLENNLGGMSARLARGLRIRRMRLLGAVRNYNDLRPQPLLSLSFPEHEREQDAHVDPF